MIQLNLLPDVKLEYIRAQRMRRLAMVMAIIVSGAAVALLVLLVLAETYQKHTLNGLNNDVTSKTNQLQQESHINNVLTVQNQINSINTLHDTEPAVTKLFDYINELTPSSITISNVTIDFNLHSFTLAGSANSLSSIDQYVDTFKFTNYTLGQHSKSAPAFSNVVLSSYGLNSQQTSTNTAPGSYSITASFDPTIFNVTKNITLIIPSIVSTRSQLENPGPLFVQNIDNSSSGSSNGGSH